MSIAGDVAAAAGKVVGVLKDVPLWLLAGLAIGANLMLFAPAIANELSSDYRPLILVLAVLSNALTFARLVDLGVDRLKSYHASRAKRRTFHMTPDNMQAHWSTHRQRDDSVTTQIDVRFLVKNLTDAPLGLVGPRLIKPNIRGEVVHADVSIRAHDRNIYGSTLHSGHRVPPRGILPASLHLMIRGVPRTAPEEALFVTFGVADDEGNEQRLKLALRGVAPVSKSKKSALLPSELAFSITDPIEKEIVSVLQSEISRYEKHGRERGAFGSIYVVHEGRQVAGFGQDSWISDSPKNQSIVEDPKSTQLHSDNLDALMSLYRRLSSLEERNKFVSLLTDRLDDKKGYLRVSYFIVCTLWRIGHLAEALRKARSLPENEIQVFGLSNVLYMLNGLLRYKHSEFTSEMLDQIESFIHDLKQEHTFLIAEKLAAIRSGRLLAQATPAAGTP